MGLTESREERPEMKWATGTHGLWLKEFGISPKGSH